MTTNKEERPYLYDGVPDKLEPKEGAVPMTIKNEPFSFDPPLSKEVRTILAKEDSQPQTPEKQALLRAVEIYLKCSFVLPCPDDCKLLRRHIGEWDICSHLQQAGELMLKREAQEDKGCYNTRTGGYVKGL